MTSNAPLGIVLFGCLTLPKYRLQVEDAYLTWIQDALKRGCRVCISTGSIPEDLDPGLKQLCVDVKEGDDYNSAMMKQWRGLDFLHQTAPCDFYFCCGSDTFLVPKNALAMLDTVEKTKQLYIGSGTPASEKVGDTIVPYFSGGAGFFLSLPLLEQILVQLPQFLLEWMPLEHVFAYGAFFEHEGDSRIHRKDLYGACDLHVGIIITKIQDVEWISIDGSRMFGCATHKQSKNPTNLISCHPMKHEDVYDFWNLLEQQQDSSSET